MMRSLIFSEMTNRITNNIKITGTAVSALIALIPERSICRNCMSDDEPKTATSTTA